MSQRLRFAPGPLAAALALIVVAAAACTAGRMPTVTPVPASPTLTRPAPTVTAPPTFAPTAPIAPSATPTTVATIAITPTPTNPPTPTLAPARLALRPLTAGLAGPVFVTHAGDGSNRLFIVDKPGVIRVYADGKLLDTPFLDIRDRVGSVGSEQGLLGLAFPPDYARRLAFFVNYTDQTGDTVVARFNVTADPNVVDPGSAFTVLKLDQPAPNHNGGMVIFGPDGNLWIGTGDGGGANDTYRNGQNPGTLLGKMLRLDVTSDPSRPYIVPADNPWIKTAWNGQDVADEVWGLGLRNPWRYSFDRRTGDLWIADVGQNQYEEINQIAATGGQTLQGGLNFGWPIMEGTHCFPATAACDKSGLTLPVADYSHQGGHCSITGGYVYRGRLFPALDGVYLYGDFCSGQIWGLTQTAAGTWQSSPLLDSDLGISSFGEDEAGELYVTDLRGGRVYQVVME